MKHIKLYIAFSFAIYVAAIIVVKALNFSAKLIIAEDSLVETLSALLFLLAFLFATYMLAIKRFASKRHMFWLAGIGGIGLLGFLDEISFGGNYFTLPVLQLGDVKIDGVHDIGILTYAVLQKILNPVTAVIIALIIGVLIVAIVILFSKKREQILSMLTDPQDYPLYFFLAAFTGCIGLALFLDLEILQISVLRVLEELLELNATLPLIFAAFYIRSLPKSQLILSMEMLKPVEGSYNLFTGEDNL